MNFNRLIFFLLFFLVSVGSTAQSGCTDPQATNYDSFAIINDGSCVYPFTIIPLSFRCYIDSTELNETSGLVKQNNNFWSHNDDTDRKIYRIDTASTAIYQRVTISNSTNIDWEDITSGNGHIFVGDVGNNGGNRTNLRFYKIPESDITDSTMSVNAGIINFTYSDQVDFTVNHNNNFYDCEAFFFMNDSIHMFTKGWVNRWTKHYVLPADTGNQIAQLVDSFNVGCLVTSAAIQGDSVIVLLGLNYSGTNSCYLWVHNKFSGLDFFSGNNRRFYLGNAFSIGQMEAICFTDTNKGFITNERFILPAQIREFDLNPFLINPPVNPAAVVSLNSITKNLNACSDSGSANFIITNNTIASGPDLYFTIDSVPAFITSSIYIDTLQPGDTTQVIFNFNSGTLTGGMYSTDIYILSNDPLQPSQIISITLNVDSNPCIEYTFVTDTCTGFTSFTSSTINTPDIYYWDFGDGDTSSLANPIHFFHSDGNYTVTLTGCNTSGCDIVVQVIEANVSGPGPAVCYPVTQNYCCGSGITSFRLTGPAGDVINNISYDASAGYEDFTCTDSALMLTNYPYVLNCTTGSIDAEMIKVWLDLNNDGIFDPVDELLFSDTDTILLSHTGFITIPALAGNVYGVPLRMRIASDVQYTIDACLDPQSGQHEDYTVILNYSVAINEFENETEFTIFPNPFSHFTILEYELEQSSVTSLKVYNILGEVVKIISDAHLQPAGKYFYQLDGLVTGVYFVEFMEDWKFIVERMVKM
jgi:hypothetical protein